MTVATRLTLKQFLELPEQKPALEFDADGKAVEAKTEAAPARK